MKLADDLFAGAGGWDVGARGLGIESRGIELMSDAVKTRDAAGLCTIHDDVWSFVPDGRASGLIGSPPCQAYTVTGSGAGRAALDEVLSLIDIDLLTSKNFLEKARELHEDDRVTLVLTPLYFALNYENYQWLALEQVTPVLPVWESCATVLKELGWSTVTGVVNSYDYGVPQTRKRAVLLASRDKDVSLPVCSSERLAIQDVVSLPASVTHQESNYSGGWRDGKRVLGMRELSEPSFTITSKVHKWVHNTGERTRLSIREAGILQSFPEDFPWQGVLTSQYLQAGNAVPPKLATALLSEVVS